MRISDPRKKASRGAARKPATPDPKRADAHRRSVATTPARRRDASASAAEGPPRLDHGEVGGQLRGARKARGFTLQVLSERSGIAVSTISKAERGEIALTYDKFAALAHALGIEFDALLGRARSAAGPMAPSFTAAGRQAIYETPMYEYGVIAGDRAGKRMVPTRGRIRARSLDDFPDFIRHPGEEFVFVLSGALALRFEDGRSFRLKAGDSLYFDSSVGHVYLSTGPRDADVLVCCAGLDDHPHPGAL
jgi:transcriptional regulator with XRE-family HTH domain